MAAVALDGKEMDLPEVENMAYAILVPPRQHLVHTVVLEDLPVAVRKLLQDIVVVMVPLQVVHLDKEELALGILLVQVVAAAAGTAAAVLVIQVALVVVADMSILPPQRPITPADAC